jgi:hypothetical protein
MAALLLLTIVSWAGSFAQVPGGRDHLDGVRQRTSPSVHRAHDCCGSLQILLTKPALPSNPRACHAEMSSLLRASGTTDNTDPAVHFWAQEACCCGLRRGARLVGRKSSRVRTKTANFHKPAGVQHRSSDLISFSLSIFSQATIVIRITPAHKLEVQSSRTKT